METCNKKVTLTSSQGKVMRCSNTRRLWYFLCYTPYQHVNHLSFQVIQFQEQSNLAFVLLVKSQSQDEPLDLEELMKYCLMPVPPSLGTPDGFFSKTNKASILHYLLESRGHHPRRSSVPQGCPVHPGWHGAATYPCQPSPNLWWDMPTGARSNGGQEALLVLDWQLPPGIYQSAGEVEAWQLREDHFGWTSDQEAIWPRCSLQMTTTKSRSASSCCEYGVTNRQLQSWREQRWQCWSWRGEPTILSHRMAR